MDFIVKRIWWITIPTALAVLAFQLYWLRTAWLGQQTAFVQVVSDGLQKAYDRAVIGSVKQLEGQLQKKDTLRVQPNKRTFQFSTGTFTDTIPLSSDSTGLVKVIARDTNRKEDNTVFQQNFRLQDVGADMNQFLASIFAFSNIAKIDTALLNKYYQEELNNRHISLPFVIHIIDKDTTITADEHMAVIRSTSLQSRRTIAAQFEGAATFLLVKILWPLVLSFFLILLITGCIWILWRIIIRQKKLETMKNDFISNITHELKTPVAILTATNEALLTFGGSKDPEKTERYLRLEQDELHKLQGLVDNIMALTRLEHNDEPQETLELVSIPMLLKTVGARFSGLPGVQIQTAIQVAREELLTQPAALRTVLSNLLDNAIKYTPSDVKKIMLTVTESPQHYRFIIRDYGIGIDKAHLPYIFDKFYRVSQGNLHTVKGYGLGLSHVKSLLNRINGTINVDSVPGQGSTFTIELAKR
ncbi:GHKL domain-containing protein [Chitinophaga sp. G-6-1-13]|uniref:histidine kinase n=1 Tax=Chitinophaga fulva TaxID=2728842 RepID=A0A848GXS8_9BACT|nr:HAMP domain-containing sensor histidine kinase [Chitinophaga fulva]NML42082.1 GHKL domain-containing protein [Chitinophaga fulva]